MPDQNELPLLSRQGIAAKVWETYGNYLLGFGPADGKGIEAMMVALEEYDRIVSSGWPQLQQSWNATNEENQRLRSQLTDLQAKVDRYERERAEMVTKLLGIETSTKAMYEKTMVLMRLVDKLIKVRTDALELPTRGWYWARRVGAIDEKPTFFNGHLWNDEPGGRAVMVWTVGARLTDVEISVLELADAPPASAPSQSETPPDRDADEPSHDSEGGTDGSRQ